MTKLRNIASGVILNVSQTTEHPDCSYGQPIWIDESNNALCQVGMEAPFYEVLQYDGKDNRLRIGKELERLRKAKKFTQQELANKSGVTRTNIAKIEGGKYSVGFDVLQRVAEALDADVKIVKR